MDEKTRRMWRLVMILAADLIILFAVSVLNAQAMKLGDSGERVVQIQSELRKKGVLCDSSEGLFDFATRKAVAEFQKMNGIEKSGEADFETLQSIGLDTECSDCFSLQTELLARCIQLSGCRTYPEMLKKAREIIGNTDGALTLGKYISINFSGVAELYVEPSADAYNAAINEIRKLRLPL